LLNVALLNVILLNAMAPPIQNQDHYMAERSSDLS